MSDTVRLTEEFRGGLLDLTHYGYISIVDEKDAESRHILTTVYQALEEKGYNPINQIVGYLLSGDQAYIPRLNDARNLIRAHERDEIIEELVRSYLKNNGETI